MLLGYHGLSKIVQEPHSSHSSSSPPMISGGWHGMPSDLSNNEASSTPQSQRWFENSRLPRHSNFSRARKPEDFAGNFQERSPPLHLTPTQHPQGQGPPREGRHSSTRRRRCRARGIGSGRHLTRPLQHCFRARGASIENLIRKMLSLLSF